MYLGLELKYLIDLHELARDHHIVLELRHFVAQRQYLYFCTSEESKLSTSVILCQSCRAAGFSCVCACECACAEEDEWAVHGGGPNCEHAAWRLRLTAAISCCTSALRSSHWRAGLVSVILYQ